MSGIVACVVMVPEVRSESGTAVGLTESRDHETEGGGGAGAGGAPAGGDGAAGAGEEDEEEGGCRSLAEAARHPTERTNLESANHNLPRSRTLPP